MGDLPSNNHIIAPNARYIKGIFFRLTTAEDLKYGVVKCRTHESFSSHDIPISGGLYDLRLGPIPGCFTCVTCGLSDKECPGHFGYYKLSVPVVQPICVEDIIKWLKIVCLKCGNLLADTTRIDKKNNTLIRLAQMISPFKRCNICNTEHPIMRVGDDSIFSFNMKDRTGDITTLKLSEIINIFSKISDETVIQVNRNVKCHPRHYISNIIPVPPTTTRPCYKGIQSKTQRVAPTMDFLKHIFRKDRSITEEDKLRSGNFINKCFFDTIRGSSQKKGELRTSNIIGGPLSDSILKTLSGKKGLIRSYQMGHRSLNGSRITISGNNRIEIDEIGIPKYVVDTLLVSEVVREYNIKQLNRELLEGKISRFKRYETGYEHTIHSSNITDIVLQFDDIVYRNIRKGDRVIFNRPPSLTESSIGAHRAVPFKYEEENTFQINVIVCTDYNADFDGDQMRLKVLRTHKAISEAEYITSIDRLLLSSQHAECVNGQVQDSLIGIAKLTNKGISLTKLHTMRLWSTANLNNPPSHLKDTYNGYDITTMLLHDTPLSYRNTAKCYNPAMKSYFPYKDENIKIIINKGKHIQGILDASSVGEHSNKSIYHHIALNYGNKTALNKMFIHQQIALKFLETTGFTVSFADMILPKATKRITDQLVRNQELKGELFTDDLINGKVYPPVGETLVNYFEKTILQKLSNNPELMGPIFSSLDHETNGLFQMIFYGSKGKISNLQQIYGYIGQTTLEAARMPYTFAPYRTSPYFARYDLSPSARGFITDSLVEGCSPKSAPFASQEARQQVVQKSQSTAISGSLLRKHTKNIENIIINYYHNTYKSNKLIQFLYGENGIDPRFLIKEKIGLIVMSNNEIRDKFYHKSSNTKNQDIYDNIYNDIITLRDQHRINFINLYRVGIISEFPDKYYCGLSVENIITLHTFNEKANESELYKMATLLVRFIQDSPYLYINKIQQKKRSPVPVYISSVLTIFKLAIYNYITVSFMKNLNIEILQTILNEIHIKFTNAIIAPGTSVGILAAQALGEPLVQIMLDAIHGSSGGAKAGLEKTRHTLGGKYPNNKQNGMIVKLIGNKGKDKTYVQNIKENIKGVQVGMLISDWSICFEYNNKPIPKFESDNIMIDRFFKNHPSMKDLLNNISPWVIRLKLDSTLMIYKAISLENIIEKIYNNIDKVLIVHSDDPLTNIVLRIHIFSSKFPRDRVQKVYEYVNTILTSINDILIRGVLNIIDGYVQPYIEYISDKDGNFIKEDRYLMRTKGSNLVGVVLNAESLDIDTLEIQLLSVMDTLEVYGIESSRSRIIEQLMMSMESKQPNYTHLALYADIISSTGKITSVEVVGKYEKNRVLPTSSGYSAQKILSNAALHGIYNTTDSTVAPIMLGSVPRVGTHYTQLCMDEEFIKQNTQSIVDTVLDF